MGSEQSCNSPSLSEQCIDRIFDNNYRYSTEIPNPFEPFCERLLPRRKTTIIRLHQVRCDPDFDPNAEQKYDIINEQQLNLKAEPNTKPQRSSSAPLNRNVDKIPLDSIPKNTTNSQKSQPINPMRKSAYELSRPAESQDEDHEEEQQKLRGQDTPEAPRSKKGQEKEAETSFAGPTNTNCTVQETYSNGSVYHGNKVNSFRQGHGVFTFPNKACYKGQWEQDKMCGRGMFYYPSGQLAYQGQFARSSFEGFGYHFNEIVDYSLAEDDHSYYQDLNAIGGKWIKYEGEFFDDNREGKGRLYMPNGDIIYGDFQNNKLQGDSFVYKAIEQRIIKGYWEDNKLIKLYQS